MNGSDDRHAFEPVDFTTPSDYASLDKQLARYFKKSASLIVVPLLFNILPLTFYNGTGIALSVFAGASLVSTVLPLLFAGRLQSRPGDRGNNSRTSNQAGDVSSLKMLCFAAYASNILLMLTAVCLASVANNQYFTLASPVLLIIVFVLGRLMYYGRRNNNFISGAEQYRSHQPDLNFFLDFTSDVAQIAVTGLSGSLAGNMKTTRRLEGTSVCAVEAFIMYAVVMSLFLMLVCTMPPALDLRSVRQRVADQFLKWGAYFSLALVGVAALLVVTDVTGAYAVFAAALIIALGAFWFYKVSSSRGRRSSASLLDDGSQQEAEARRHAAGERSPMWIVIHSVMFGTMMAYYSAFRSGQHLSDIYKPSVFCVFAAQLANISWMVLVRETRDDTVDASVVRVLEMVMVFFMLLTLPLLILVGSWLRRSLIIS